LHRRPVRKHVEQRRQERRQHELRFAGRARCRREARTESEPPIDELARRIGDFQTDDGKKRLGERSPAQHIDALRKPILIAQGMKDTRVVEADVAKMAAAIKSHKVAVTYVVYDDEAHGLTQPNNRLSFTAIADVFLAQCLGGPYEPPGKDLATHTFEVPVGVEYIHGLRDALKK
jgi:hypothetical protein